MSRYLETTQSIAMAISILQSIQTANNPDSRVWKVANDALAPLLSEMSARRLMNQGEPNWRKWTAQS